MTDQDRVWQAAKSQWPQLVWTMTVGSEDSPYRVLYAHAKGIDVYLSINAGNSKDVHILMEIRGRCVMSSTYRYLKTAITAAQRLLQDIQSDIRAVLQENSHA